MTVRIELTHHTHYRYDRTVYLSPQLMRLRPAGHTRAIVESYSLTVEPDNHLLHWQQDPFGNFMARVDFTGPVQSMGISVQLIAVLEAANPFDFFIDTQAEVFPFDYTDKLKKELVLYREQVEPGPYLTQWVSQIKQQTKRGTIDFLVQLNQQISQAITYQERLQSGVQTPEETLRRAMGSCRDVAWLLVQLARQLGLAARFVSGYLAELAVNPQLNQESPHPVKDSLSLHAWAEVYIPGAGWLGLDPTSGLLTTQGHIPLACTPDPTDAAPVTGLTNQAETALTYSSTLVRLPG